MKQIIDLHIHSRYSRATSKNLSIDSLEKWAKIKGVNVLGTSDFTHPEWQKELKQKLIREEEGIYFTKNNFPFIYQTEISLMYSQDGSGKRVHVVVLAPSREVSLQITDYLKSKGRVDYDGRPIFKITAYEFTEELMKISKDIEIIPAHIWTPWFGLLGSKSGFNSFEQAFKDQVKNIHALETGISSDPPMNWRVSSLDKFEILSFSDLHSYWPWRLGREATIFDLKKLTYKNIINSIREKKIDSTIEFFPEEGKYHYDGHRKCDICLNPKQSKELNNICPRCGKPLTIGVMNRVEELADRLESFGTNQIPKNKHKFYKLVPLSELITGVYGGKVNNKKTWQIYDKLISKYGNEFNILLNEKFDNLKKFDEKLANLILKNREMKIKFQPGYDGEYGYPIFDASKEIKNQNFKKIQKGLGDFV